MACSVASAAFGQDDPAEWRMRKAATAQAAAGATTDDVSEEIRLGREIAARIIGRYGLQKDDELNRYVNLVGKLLASNSGRQEIEYRFGVLSTDEINAYAAPGGYVFVTRGAIAKMQDEAELAGVLAHEIAHVNQKHIVRELNVKATEDSPAAGFARLVGGTSEAARTAFSQAVDKALDILFTNGYKREDEIESDRLAVNFAAFSGYDALALPRYLERIGPLKEPKKEVLDKTHPGYQDRVAWLTAAVKEDSLDAAGTNKARQRFEQMKGSIK